MDPHNTMVSAASTGVGAVMTAIQTNPVYQVVSLIITILGLIVTICSSIVFPIVKWYRKAKEDGKITKDELSEAQEIVEKGTKDIKDHIDQGKQKD